MAKKRGVRGWHSMRKDELVKALLKSARQTDAKAAGSANGSPKNVKKVAKGARPVSAKNGEAAKNGKNGESNGRKGFDHPTLAPAKSKSPRVMRRIQEAHAQRESRKDLAAPVGVATLNGASKNVESGRERIVLMVRDPYWLHAHWEVSRACVDRARAALAEHWHTARPILRLYEIDSGATTNNAERVSRDVEIHGGVQNWYIDVDNPPNSYVVEIGYVAADNRFHSIARSNVVTTPRPGTSNSTDENWADVAANFEKIYAMSGGYSLENQSGELQELFEERLKRPMGSPMNTRYGMGAERFLNKPRNFELQVDAEMIIHGVTKPDAYVTLSGEPVKVAADGSFSIRMELGNQRQVLPIVSESPDGVEQRTVVIAVERNTKVMEPVVRDMNDL